MSCGPKLGYNPNASKSWLVVKPQAEEKAREIFGGTGINITTKGKIAKTEPQASYAAFCERVQNQTDNYIRTIPNTKYHLMQLDTIVDNAIIPGITDSYMCTVDERCLIFLLAEKGDLAILHLFPWPLLTMSLPTSAQLLNRWLNI